MYTVEIVFDDNRKKEFRDVKFSKAIAIAKTASLYGEVLSIVIIDKSYKLPVSGGK